jgi:glucose-1-phosphate adenylyltransferase
MGPRPALSMMRIADNMSTNDPNGPHHEAVRVRRGHQSSSGGHQTTSVASMTPVPRRGDVLAIIQAGGKGSRMDVLTRERAKPALPFGGVHRLIDFALSAVAQAELTDVWVSVQYQAASLDDYLSGGRPWSLDRNRGGFRRMVPQTGAGPSSEAGFAEGNADLLLKLRRDIERHAPEHVLVVSADHVFNADLHPVVQEHVRSGCTATVLTADVTKREASDNVVLRTRPARGWGNRVTGIEVKPSRPSSGTVATEIFIYRADALLTALEDLRREGAGGDDGLGDFGEHLLPRLVETGDVRAVPLDGYWRDLGQPGQYLQAHRDLIDDKVDVFDHLRRPVISHWPDLPAARVTRTGHAVDSVLAPGCRVAGRVERSVLGPGVVVEEGALVVDSVLMDRVRVEAGATVQTAIVDSDCVVEAGGRLGERPASRRARDEEIVMVGRDSTVHGTIPAGARLEPGTRA